MRVQLVALSLAVCWACLFAVQQSSRPTKPQQAEAINFDVLRVQARAALETLQSQEHGLASAAGKTF